MVMSENPICNIFPQSTLPGPSVTARKAGKYSFPMDLGRRNEINEHLATFSFAIMMVSPFHVMWGERGKMEGTEREESVCQKCSPLACRQLLSNSLINLNLSGSQEQPYREGSIVLGGKCYWTID